MSAFLEGFFFWWRGWMMLLRRPSLLVIAVVPALISLGLALSAATWLYGHLPGWARALVEYALADYPTLLQILFYPLALAGGLMILIVTVFLAYFAHLILAIPFYSILADRTLVLSGVKQSSPFSMKAWIRTTVHMLLVGLVKAAIFLVLALILFIFSFIPPFNIPALLAPLLLIAFDLLDFSFEALGYGLGQRFAFVGRNRLLWLGMASGLGLTLVIPGLTLLVAPGAVVGAALLIKKP